ncbi:hypothetical protein BST16_18405 [Mycobacterium asiaticum DSM 44297]|uniref:Uncharacterized protein n=2 Tax=Mycobacterium asiaticum TaxID=1790 RepID=A0A1A3KHJ5_MYCAS|nr:hypothetical protein A5640_15330 [Mycobacterium asiaticum]ORA11836.1 hypothetical protein BST16_18405 [Mycobacterium asiaticum DSM 44297]
MLGTVGHGQQHMPSGRRSGDPKVESDVAVVLATGDGVSHGQLLERVDVELLAAPAAMRLSTSSSGKHKPTQSQHARNELGSRLGYPR